MHFSRYKGSINPSKPLEIKKRKKRRKLFVLTDGTSTDGSSITTFASTGSTDMEESTISSMDEANEMSNEFQQCVVPFSSCRLTSMGREKMANLEMDDRVKIESIGITLMDGINGPFIIDIARIRAVTIDEDGAVYDPVEDPEDKSLFSFLPDRSKLHY